MTSDDLALTKYHEKWGGGNPLHRCTNLKVDRAYVGEINY